MTEENIPLKKVEEYKSEPKQHQPREEQDKKQGPIIDPMFDPNYNGRY